MEPYYKGKVAIVIIYVHDLVVRNMVIPMDITYDCYDIPTKNNN